LDYKNLMNWLTGLAAVSGHEETLALHISEEFKKYCDKVEIDRFYNVVGIKKGSGDKRKKVMVAAHMDEIGFMIKSIDEKGFIRVTNIGGIDSRVLPAQEVVIHGKRDVPGVFGAKPPHLMDSNEEKKALKLKDLYIDTGLDVTKVKEVLSIGDTITFVHCPLELKGGNFSSKSVDNRCGTAAVLGAMKELSEVRHGSDIYFVCTVQEEVRLTGAITASYNINPDAAVVIDACHGDMPDASKDEVYKLGKGPAVGIGPNLHKGLTKKAMEIAAEENIPFQVDVEPGNSGTDAWAVQVSRCGIPTVLFSIPVRFMHTPVETANLRDIKNTACLTARFITKAEQDNF
jgi:putative aminopeptidase FrvX